MLCTFDDLQSPHHRPCIPRSLRFAPPYAEAKGAYIFPRRSNRSKRSAKMFCHIGSI